LTDRYGTTFPNGSVKKTASQHANARLLAWVDRFRDIPVLVVGDLMVDRAYRGPAERISPEAPVPVIHVQEESWTPGGAGNVVNNLRALGARSSIVSLRGDDATGEDLEVRLRELGVDISGLITDPDPRRPTITKTRVFAGHQQVARFDFEKRGGLSDEMESELVARVNAMVPAHKAVIISDYGKGVVTPGVIRAILKAAEKKGVPVVVDPKIEHFFQYRGVDCITPNTKEAVEGARAFPPKSEEELLALGEKILRRLRSRSLLITRGEKCMTLFEKGKTPDTIPALAQEVYDVTGAGDTVVSTFSLCRAVGAPHAAAARIANIAASLVVAKVGTAVATVDELTERMSRP
jgi:D-beta-D-heptose 7-phosphate kinase/D-beta-D-heptose 1-phosphate adenosyltransferase